jgi:N-methylhydantoinase A
MLISDLKHDYVRTFARELSNVDVSELQPLYREMADSARQTLATERVPEDRIELEYSADLHYVGQFNEVEVPAGTDLTAAGLDKMVDAFHDRHDTLYGYSMPGAPVELINLRVSARGITEKPHFERSEPGGEDPSHAQRATRRAFFDGEFREVPVYDGLKLINGNVVEGPAIVDQPTTTIVVPSGFDLRCDEFNNYLMHPKGEQVDELRARLLKEN